MPKALRSRKIFIDWSQNADFKTTVSVYSLRAKSTQPFVSVPVSWDELQRALKSGDSRRLRFSPDAAIERLDELGDLFKPVLSLRQSFPAEFAAQIEKTPTEVGSRVALSLNEYQRKRNFTRTSERVS
jgi:bifunctional non-homologous end joining protein LigD